MLLRHTPKEVAKREALTINPAKTCQPVGAMYAALGIHGCLPHSHGSQGCCSYHRSALTRHYKEPVMAATSSFTEGSSVFGGQSNLLQAIQTIFTTYDPQVIAVHTTCLSETIGDDIPQIISMARDEGRIPDGKFVIHANTPSYVGSHVTGFANQVTAMVKYFSEKTERKTTTVNIIPGWVEPGDMQELKRLCAEMEQPCILFPDTDGVLNAPLTGRFEMYPTGGVTVEQLRRTGASGATLALGRQSSWDAGRLLETKCGVPVELLDIPIGLKATDRFLHHLMQSTRQPLPRSLQAERGRVLDVLSDMHQYLFGKRVALFGDPDHLLPLMEFLVDMDMVPAMAVSGTPGKHFEERARAIAPNIKVKCGQTADTFLLHQWMLNEPVDLLIGNTYGKYIARDMDLPFLRYGFPILDRIGHPDFPMVGYRGAMRWMERILDLFLDRQDRDAPETSFELTL